VVLAKRDGNNYETNVKRKRRTSVTDVPTDPKQARSTMLSADEEAIVAALESAFCCRLMTASMPATNPTQLTRSALHRWLQRNGIYCLPSVQSGTEPKSKFKPRCYSIKGGFAAAMLGSTVRANRCPTAYARCYWRDITDE
jgi:hypothetical protein